jgi:hypothetical protein
MDLTIVSFRVFDQPHARFFEDKSLSEIHKELSKIWPTYHPTRILHCSDAREVNTETLLKFKDPDAPDYIRGVRNKKLKRNKNNGK